MLFLALKMVQLVKINPQVGQNQSSILKINPQNQSSILQLVKIKSPSKISYPPNGGNFPHPPHPVALFGKSCRRESSFIPAPKILKV